MIFYGGEMGPGKSLHAFLSREQSRLDHVSNYLTIYYYYNVLVVVEYFSTRFSGLCEKHQGGILSFMRNHL